MCSEMEHEEGGGRPAKRLLGKSLGENSRRNVMLGD